jgi:xylulokinase
MATGKFVCAIPNASAIAIDFEKRSWDYALIELLQLNKEQFPKLVESGEIVGPLTPKAAGDIGLPQGIPVFGGCTDILGIELGSGCTKPGDSYFYLGTSGLTGVVTKGIAHYSPYGVPLASYKPENTTILATSEITGGCIDWAVETLFKAEKDIMGQKVLEYANGRLPQTKAGADNLFFTTWLYGERNPIMDEFARGTFINLSYRHTRDHMLRAVYEGIAYQMVWIVNEMEKEYGVSKNRMRACGGGSKSSNLMQIMADISGRAVDVAAGSDLIVAKGTGLIALLALDFLSLDDVAQLAKISKSYEPCKQNAELYREGRERYREIYTSLKKLFWQLNER